MEHELAAASLGLYWGCWYDTRARYWLLPLGSDDHHSILEVFRPRHACSRCKRVDSFLLWFRMFSSFLYLDLMAMLTYFSRQRPFLNYYGCTFILYELSSPFLNFPLVFRQAGHDRIAPSTNKWHLSTYDFLLLSPSLGNVSVSSRVSRCLEFLVPHASGSRDSLRRDEQYKLCGFGGSCWKECRTHP